MNEKEALQTIEGHLQRSATNQVLYLEGRTDGSALFALLGVETPDDSLHQGVFVCPLPSRKGSGGKRVRSYVELAERAGYPGVFGVIDGDGAALAEASAQFDAPFAGPLFVWRAYCIENLLVKAGWPAEWGAEPDWTEVMLRYTPYIGLNRIHVDLRGRLETLQLARLENPKPGRDFLQKETVLATLQQDKELLVGIDVAEMFGQHCSRWETTARASLDEAHALLNGKWLINHFAATTYKERAQVCRQLWEDAVRANGGLDEVKEWWERLFGAAP